MRYVEQVKSIVLLLLVLSSLVLTFLIWSYTPNFQIIEEQEVEQIMIGKQKEIKDVLKPSRIIVRENGQWFGTLNTFQVDWILANLSDWKSTELNLIQWDLKNQDINEIIRKNKRMTMFFPEEVPISTYSSIMSFAQTELPPEVTFTRLIVDWGKVLNNTMQIHFVSERNRTLYSTHVTVPEESSFLNIQESFHDLIPYEEMKRNNQLSLYVPKNQMELTQYKYFIDEIAQEQLKEALFTDPMIVQKNTEDRDSTKYTDGIHLMNVDTTTKQVEYVYPASESFASIPAFRLLNDSFEFVNEHGGFTDDFRFVSMNVSKHITEYQLFKQGYPVISNSHVTPTRISTRWGEKEIFQYKRPYYRLDIGLPWGKSIYQLPSGVEVIQMIDQSSFDLDKVEDIVLGYYLIPDENKEEYTLEPSWFVIHDGSWGRLTSSETQGGTGNGLE